MNDRAVANRPIRRAFVLGLALIVLAGGGAIGESAPATQPAPSGADRALLQRLDSGTWRQRQSAQDELEAQPDVDDATIRAMLADTKNPEAQARLQAILKYLAEQLGRGAGNARTGVRDLPALGA